MSAAKFSEKTAKGLHEVVETLVYQQSNGIIVPEKRTESWVKSACREIQEKLANVGLIVVTSAITCKNLWDEFLNFHQREIKDSTMKTYLQSKSRFFLFFEEGEYIENLTRPRMLDWKKNLLDRFSHATVAGTIAKAKAVFNWAVEFDKLHESPLNNVGRGDFVNRKNDREITMDEYSGLLAACPCVEWRGILALARIGGLRCPSELLRLRWKDVEWEKNRFYVQSPKTEQHRGKEGRWVPLFPELRTELDGLRQARGEETEFVINRYRDPENTNLGTQFARIVKKAGLSPIKRPFDNMRMSRSNEVYRRWGSFKEREWIGHTGQVRDDHYLMMGDDDYSEAAKDE